MASESESKSPDDPDLAAQTSEAEASEGSGSESTSSESQGGEAEGSEPHSPEVGSPEAESSGIESSDLQDADDEGADSEDREARSIGAAATEPDLEPAADASESSGSTELTDPPEQESEGRPEDRVEADEPVEPREPAELDEPVEPDGSTGRDEAEAPAGRSSGPTGPRAHRPPRRNAARRNAGRRGAPRRSPDAPPRVAAGEASVAWKRLRRAFGWRPSRAQIAGAVLLAVLGFAATVQVNMLRSEEEYASASRSDLVQHLDTLQQHSARLRAEIRELERDRTTLVDGADQSAEALRLAEERAETLGILAGVLPATGPGIRLTIPDTADPVTANLVINTIEELRDAGAEALEVNDRVRIVAGSYQLDTPDGLLVDDTLLRPPYMIDAIGDPEALSKAMTIPGGVADDVERLGGQVTIEERRNVQIDALREPTEREHAEAVDTGGS